MLIFSDIDGTLINDQHVVTKKTQRTIKEAVQRGHTFVPVSARMPAAILPICKNLDSVCPIISYNGALIQLANGDIISSTPFPFSLALEICQWVTKHYSDIVWNIYRFDKWFSPCKDNSWVRQEEDIVQVSSIEASLEELNDLEVVHKVLLMGNPDKIAIVELDLKEHYPTLSIVKSAPYFIEIMHEGVDKGKAVSLLVDYLKVPHHQMIAFGDNYNDFEMLQAVGKGFVMSNGPTDLKKLIGNVTDDNNHDGIANILEDLLGLGK